MTYSDFTVAAVPVQLRIQPLRLVMHVQNTALIERNIYIQFSSLFLMS